MKRALGILLLICLHLAIAYGGSILTTGDRWFVLGTLVILISGAINLLCWGIAWLLDN